MTSLPALAFLALAGLAAGNVLDMGPTNPKRIKDDPPINSIVGGSEVVPHSWPFLVQISAGGNNPTQSIFCGGSILNEEWILTAAHCFYRRTDANTLSRFRVTAAEHDITRVDPDEQRRSIAQAILHPDYNSRTLDNDIALLRLSSPLDLSVAKASPVVLNDDDNCPTSGAQCDVAGWGTLSSGGSTPDVPHSVTVPAVSNAECIEQYGQGEITDNMVCAGAIGVGGVDSCQGDSGGPFVCQCGGRTKHVGIVSWGYGCAAARYPGVYARTSKYISWIQGYTEICDPQ